MNVYSLIVLGKSYLQREEFEELLQIDHEIVCFHTCNFGLFFFKSKPKI